MVVPCAQLRVFLAVDALDERDRERWHERGALGTRAAALLEDEVQRRRLLGRPAAVPDGAVLVRRAGEQLFVCPLQHDLRCAVAFRQLREDVAPVRPGRLLGDDALATRLDGLGLTGRRPTVVDAPWAVPVTWFVAVSDRDRRLLRPVEGVGPRLRYLTVVARALGRVERAMDLVDELGTDAVPVLDELADLADWLGAFDARSLLELDYGGLAQVLTEEQLEADRSARDVAAALDALEAGDVMGALARHAVVRGRWSRLHRAALTC